MSEDLTLILYCASSLNVILCFHFKLICYFLCYLVLFLIKKTPISKILEQISPNRSRLRGLRREFCGRKPFQIFLMLFISIFCHLKLLSFCLVLTCNKTEYFLIFLKHFPKTVLRIPLHKRLASQNGVLTSKHFFSWSTLQLLVLRTKFRGHIHASLTVS